VRPLASPLSPAALAAALLACAPGGERSAPDTARPAAERGARDANASPPGPVGSAAAGDTVLVVVNHVKADKRQQFERFIEAFWAAGRRLAERDSLSPRTFAQTRVLYPAGPDADGTYAYVFLMDPLVRGASYDIPLYLRRMYPPAQADSMDRAMNDALARPQAAWTVVESRVRQ
jgi:hypothetical protein